jgi:hypothetical protein
MPVPWSFEKAFDRLFPQAEEAARDVVGDRSVAEDIAVDTLAAVYRRWDRIGALPDLDEHVLRMAAERARRAGSAGKADRAGIADGAGNVPAVGPERPRPTPHQFLELVVARAEGRWHGWRRRRGIVAIGAAAAVAVAVALLVAVTSPSSRHVVAIAPQVTGAPLATPTFVQTTLPSPASTLGTQLSVSAATTARPLPTSIPCRNSTDPACGPFRWDPAPGRNQPIDIQLSYEPAEPHIGDVVMFTARVVDPDASPITSGDETCNPPSYSGTPSRCSPNCPSPGYGPWTPPPRQRGDRIVKYSHQYTEAGSFTASFWFGSAGGCARNPYSSAAESAVTINVSPAPSAP